ncbi:MAG: hypothetical protein D6723_10915, partial [Acidobacteria bacterium]
LILGTLIQYLPTREEFTLILQRLERLEQRMERLETEMVEMRKEQITLREDFNRMQQTISEMQQTIAGILQRLERVERQQAIIIEQATSFQRETRAHFDELHKAFGRLGLLTESVLRNALQTAVEKWFGTGRVERMELAGREVDVVIRDSEHILLEITARAHLQDIDKLKASAKDYERRFHIKPRLAIACAYATPTVIKRLAEEGIELISAEVPE